MFSEQQIKKNVELCAEFMCGECPYNIYEDENKEYSLRCIHKLMVDINYLLNSNKERK